MENLNADAIANELNVNPNEVQNESIIEPDALLGSDDSLFDDFTEDDLIVPETIIFLKGEVVEATILEITEVIKAGGIRLSLNIENTDHQGKIHELMVFKPKPNAEGKINPIKKKQFVQFLLAFFSKDQILKKEINWNQFIGRKMKWKTAEAREYNGKTYQDSYDFALIADNGEGIF